VRLWPDPPGVPLEQGRYTALVAPPEPLLALLALPEIDRFTALYLYGAVPPAWTGSPGAASRRGEPARRTLAGGG